MTTMKKPARMPTITLNATRVAVLLDVVRALHQAGENERATKLREAFPVEHEGASDLLLASLIAQNEDMPREGDNGPILSHSEDVDVVPFPGYADLPWSSPRIQARRSVREAPSRPPLIRSDVKWRVDCLWERWRYRIGEMHYGRFAMVIKPALDVYSFGELWNAIEALYESRELARGVAFVPSWQQFVDDLRNYVRVGKMPYRNDVGDLTSRGVRVFGER